MEAGEERGDGGEPVAVTAVRGSGPLYPKLRPGPGRTTDQVHANQRARLMGAMVELVAESGYGGVTVRGLSRLAGVSTKTFYACFRNVEDCFAAAYARIVRDALRRATELPPGSQDRLQSRIRAIFAVLDEEPKAARLVLVDALSAGPGLIAKSRASGRVLERFIGGELAAAAGPTLIQSGIVDGAAAAALHLARSRLLFDRPESVSAMADEFSDWLMAVCGDSKLRPGRSVTPKFPMTGLKPDLADDRSFLVAAVTRLSVRGRYTDLTVPAICREAGVSRRNFDQHFGGVADCFLAAVEALIMDSLGHARAHAAVAACWERAVVRVIAILCAEIAREPSLARLALVDVLAPGEPGLRLREQTVVRVARVLRQTAPVEVRPALRAAEASVAAAMSIVTSDAIPGRSERAGRTAPAVAYVVLAPALGGSAAEWTIASELRALARE